MWTTKLKIAIVEKNVEAIDALLDNLPQLKQPKEIEEALYLLREGAELIYTLKDETAKSMSQIQKSIKFLKSTSKHSYASNRLDIKS